MKKIIILLLLLSPSLAFGFDGYISGPIGATSGGSMTWPGGGAGVPNYGGSSAWGTSYSATNPFPYTFIPFAAPGPIGGTTPDAGTFTTVTANKFVGSKTSGRAGYSLWYDDSTTQTYGFGLLGPTGSMTYNRVYQTPNAAGTLGQVLAVSTAPVDASASCTGVDAPYPGCVTTNTGNVYLGAFGWVTPLTGGSTLGSWTSGAGTVTSSDTYLAALQKIDGNVGSKAPAASPTFTGTATFVGVTETVIPGGSCSTSYTPNLNNGTMFTLTLSGACALNSPTGLAAGKSFTVKLTQSSTVAPTFNAVYKWAAGTAPTWSVTATKYDVFSCASFDGSTLQCAGIIDAR